MAHRRPPFIPLRFQAFMKPIFELASRFAAAAAATAMLVACTSNEPLVTPATYADDAGTTARVRIALMQDERWRTADLQITTEGGIVQITGNAPADSDLGEAELQKLVHQIDGVQATDIDLD